ncbi:Vacuolar protein sorting-associated protein 3 [Sarracenia purpurea var. burkii]
MTLYSDEYGMLRLFCLLILLWVDYLRLLEMYLDPKDGKEPMFKAAVRLLHNHGESLDPLQVLERLSPDMPLQLASDTILRMLRARLHHHRQGQFCFILFSMIQNLSWSLDLTSVVFDPNSSLRCFLLILLIRTS